MAVDLVILNEDDSVYRQSLHDQIISLIASGIETNCSTGQAASSSAGRISFPTEDHVLLQTCARLVLSNDGGLLADQLHGARGRIRRRPHSIRRGRAAAAPPRPELPRTDLIYFNGLGGFTPDGREYVITLPPGKSTPAPWVNVIGNPGFGTLVSESGSAYSWARTATNFA